MNNYTWYESDTNEAWKSKILSSFYTIRNEVDRKLHKEITIPNFHINSNLNFRWGEWNPNTRTITLSLNLLKSYEWKAVEHVLRHELAHLMVDEIFQLEGKPHGEAWHLACSLLNIDPLVKTSADYMSQFKGGNPSPIIEKIQKLITHGNDSTISNEESQLFLSKAQELIIKHNVSLHTLNTDKTFFTFRPVGPLVPSTSTWLNNACALIQEHYNVNYIWMYCRVNDPSNPNYGKQMRRIEFYGTTDNLDVAEYVFHALLTQAESIWKQYKDIHQQLMKLDPQYKRDMGTSWNGNTKRLSKDSFLLGLIKGYSDKLGSEQTVIFDSISPDDQAIISANDGILKEAFNAHYHPRNISFGSRKIGKGYHDGIKAGSSLSLASGVTKGSGSRLQLA